MRFEANMMNRLRAVFIRNAYAQARCVDRIFNSINDSCFQLVLTFVSFLFEQGLSRLSDLYLNESLQIL